jgi:4-hydroxy-tetrahydrodipicolinate reductase
MPKIIISGCNGYMGRTVARIVGADGGVEVAAGFDVNTEKTGAFPVYADPMVFGGRADAIVDFSNPSALETLLGYAVYKKTPLVLCTTGYDDKQLGRIRETSEKIPVFKSGNMSVGINLMIDLIKKSLPFSARLTTARSSKAHRARVDAPSGTALMLADAARSALPYDADYVYERQSVRKTRQNNEIGISSLRGGTIVGEHKIVFAGSTRSLDQAHGILARNLRGRRPQGGEIHGAGHEAGPVRQAGPAQGRINKPLRRGSKEPRFLYMATDG